MLGATHWTLEGRPGPCHAFLPPAAQWQQWAAPSRFIWGLLSSLTEMGLEQLCYIITGLSPKTQISDLMCKSRGELTLVCSWGGACGMEGLVQWVKCKNYKNNAMCNGQRHLVPNCTLIQTFVFHWRLFLGLQHNWWLAAWLCTKEKSYEAVQGHQAEDFWWFQACSSVRTLDA